VKVLDQKLPFARTDAGPNACVRQTNIGLFLCVAYLSGFGIFEQILDILRSESHLRAAKFSRSKWNN
jgi:hypothetical protein